MGKRLRHTEVEIVEPLISGFEVKEAGATIPVFEPPVTIGDLRGLHYIAREEARRDKLAKPYCYEGLGGINWRRVWFRRIGEREGVKHFSLLVRMGWSSNQAFHQQNWSRGKRPGGFNR